MRVPADYGKWASAAFMAGGIIENLLSGIKVDIDDEIVKDVVRMINRDLADFSDGAPNLCKVAGVAAYWFSALKPFSKGEGSRAYFLRLNEFAAVLIGIAVVKSAPSHACGLSRRLILDWMTSLRYRAGSPAFASAMAVEMLRDNR